MVFTGIFPSRSGRNERRDGCVETPINIGISMFLKYYQKACRKIKGVFLSNK